MENWAYLRFKRVRLGREARQLRFDTAYYESDKARMLLKLITA
jgi:hypothetical protein